MALEDEIHEKRPQIKTDSYPMSIGELMSLYKDDELDVHPEFQRIYRWTDSQKTRLIESILLGIPIPPIFVAQREDGVWDVVDGVQRLSTILQFVGLLKDRDGQQVPPLELEGTRFLPSLQGKTWEMLAKSASKGLQLSIKRAKLDINIVLKESSEKTKYELFMRLNTGGTALEPQEVRNCLMIMAYPKTYEWILKLSQIEDFVNAIALTDQSISEQYPMELATRFVLFRKMSVAELGKVGDISDFLNDHLEHLDKLRESAEASEEKVFRETFRFIYSQLEDSAFRRFDKSKNRFMGGFLISGFELVALGLGFNIDDDGQAPVISGFIEKVQSAWSNADFFRNSGSGVRASIRIPRLVPQGRKLFAP